MTNSTAEQKGRNEPKGSNYDRLVFAAEVGDSAPNVDLHGMDAEDAILEVDSLINAAYSSGDEVVKIIHGRGTGTLRNKVQEYLRRHPMVEHVADAQASGSLGGVTFAVIIRK